MTGTRQPHDRQQQQLESAAVILGLADRILVGIFVGHLAT